MKKISIGIMMLTISSLMANADVIVSTDPQSADQGTSQVSVINNAGTPIANTAVVPNHIGNANGSAFSGGSLSTGVNVAFFTFTVDSYRDYATTAATNAASGNGYNEYIDGLTDTSVATWGAGGWGSNDKSIPEAAATRFQLTSSNGEGLRFTLSGLSADHEVKISAITMGGFANAETADIIFYDSETDSVISSSQLAASSTNVAAVGFTMTQGDFFTIANGTVNGFYVDNFTADLIPEPTTLGLVAAFGGGILFIRRRMTI